MLSQLREALTSTMNTEDTLDWFRKSYFPEMMRRINSDDSRRRMALYEGEKLRTNERNLTDTRTRVGLLLEHDFTRLSNELLVDEGIHDLFWTYVVSNRFPDLEVHSDDGKTHMRVEMKALESRAEEKSANFATLVKDIDPNTDYLVVCLWCWDDESCEGGKIAWEKSVRVMQMYVFHAYSLARIRDYYWLNNPPKKCKYFQGIDLRTAVSCNDRGLSVEEHNMGKILRLWGGGVDDLPDSFSPIERKTLKDYLLFVDEVYDAGFNVISVEILESVGNSQVSYYLIDDFECPEADGIAVVPGKLNASRSKARRMEIAEDSGAEVICQLAGNYKCTAWKVDISIEYDSKLFGNEKPKDVPRKLLDQLRDDD